MAACIYVDGRANLIVNLAPDFLCSISIIPNPINSRILINIYSLITLARFFFFFFSPTAYLHDLLLIWTVQLIWSKIKNKKRKKFLLLSFSFRILIKLFLVVLVHVFCLFSMQTLEIPSLYLASVNKIHSHLAFIANVFEFLPVANLNWKIAVV